MSETPHEPDANEPGDLEGDELNEFDALIEEAKTQHANDRGRPDRLAVFQALSFALLAAVLIVMVMLPVPYAVERPGPTVNTTGERDGATIITVTGAETYPIDAGELRLTTVTVSGGPGNPVSMAEAIQGWIANDTVVFPRELAFPPNSNAEQMSEYQKMQMLSSQSNAAAAALQELGYDVPMVLNVVEAMEGSPAAAVVKEDDVIKAVTRDDTGERREPATFKNLTDFLREIPPSTPLTLTVERNGNLTDLTFTTIARPQDDTRPGSLIGVYIFADVTLPFTVDFEINRIGGSSAGTMFALGIVDLLTPGNLAGDVTIAGSGTMSVDGYVGPIGGIRQKMHGAVRDGATWFLAPTRNCNEVVGEIPDGLQVVAIEELSDAVDAVKAIARGDGATLPTCEQPAS